MTNPPLRRLLPQRVRTRLTVLYALLFLLAGASLLALTYALLASRLPATTDTSKSVARAPAICKQLAQSGKNAGAKALKAGAPPPGAGAKATPNSLIEKCNAAFVAGARAGSRAEMANP